ncbi:CBN-ATM-1 protein [Caenorhabditis brenneri]|uniref:non-specific serine/threonine protein kinase n=1 Tax=Caenorhabditis brenneri TaxID=135651 RepID=G0PCN3_CAEBE|nr:CBN-ATM-1 protein [Caenorhabditis brenneri]
MVQLYNKFDENILEEDFTNIYPLYDLTTHIFRLAKKEVEENQEKFDKHDTKIRTSLFQLSLKHLKICCKKPIDHNTIRYISYILTILDIQWVQLDKGMEMELSKFLVICSAASQLHWAEHLHVKTLWEFIWRRVEDPRIDDLILKNYVEMAVEILKHVDFVVFEDSVIGLVKTVMGTFKKTVELDHKTVWSHKKKYSVVYILSYIVRRWGLEARDYILQNIFDLTDYMLSLISVELTTGESKICMMHLVDDIIKLAMIDTVKSHRTISQKTEENVRNLVKTGIVESLKSASKNFQMSATFSISDEYIGYLARWFLVERRLDPQESLDDSFDSTGSGGKKKELNEFSLEGLIHLSFGANSLHKFRAWNGAIQILNEMLKSQKLDSHLSEKILTVQWERRKSFQSETLRATFCQLLATVIPLDLRFGYRKIPSIDSILKYTLSLMPNLTSLPNAAFLMESILRYRSQMVPKGGLQLTWDTVSRTSPGSLEVLRLISALISFTEFDENSRFANDESVGSWSLRKDIIEWLLADPCANSHRLLYELCQFHPVFCYENETVSNEDVLLQSLCHCKLMSLPKNTAQKSQRPIEKHIQEIVNYVHDKLKSLLASEINLPSFVLSYEFSMKFPDVSFDFKRHYEQLYHILEDSEESDVLPVIQHFTEWPRPFKLPQKLVASQDVSMTVLHKNLHDQLLDLSGFQEKAEEVIENIVESSKKSPGILEKARKLMVFNGFVKNFIMENSGDPYQMTKRFEKYAFLLAHHNLLNVREMIIKRALKSLEDEAIGEPDMFIFEKLTSSALIRNIPKISGYHFDPTTVALNADHFAFDERNLKIYLKALKKSPFLAQNIVRSVLGNSENMWHLHGKLLKMVVKNESLLTATESVELGLKHRLISMLQALTTSEFCRKTLQNTILKMIFKLTFRSVFLLVIREDCTPDIPSYCSDLKLRNDLLRHRIGSVPSKNMKDFRSFEENMSYSVENFLKYGIESSSVDYLNFGLVEFYKQLNENLTEEAIKANEQRNIFIVDILSAVWHELPSMRPQIRPIVARFHHLSPPWTRFPQPPHTSATDEQSFLWKLRFHLTLKMMNAKKWQRGEFATYVMLLLTSYDESHFKTDLIDSRQIEKLKMETKRNVMCILSKILKRETAGESEVEVMIDERLFEAITRSAAIFNKSSLDARLKVLLKFHSVCVEQLSKLEEYLETRSFRMKKEVISVFEAQLQTSRMARANSRDEGAQLKTRQRVRKEQQIEKADVEKVENLVLSAANKAVSSAFDALSCISQLDDDQEAIRLASLIVFPLIDIIYKYERDQGIIEHLKEHAKSRVPSNLWLCATSHLASKCFSVEKAPSKRYLSQILCHLIFDYPYHVLHTILMYEYEPNGSEVRGFLKNTFAVKTDRDVEKLKEIVYAMREAHAAYRELAYLDSKGDPRVKRMEVNGKTVLAWPKDLKIFKCKLHLLPIPTISQKIGRPGDLSTNNLITWKSHQDTFTIADGLSAPKIWEIQGSDGKWYKTVWKKDDVRQDVLVEQMFDVTNNMLEKRMLRTYNVVPLDTECGIIEFCGGTVSLKELLCGANRNGGLHQEFNPEEQNAAKVSIMMKQVQAESTETRRRVFRDICQEYSPVFRHFFYTQFPTAHIWRQKIIDYRRSLATWSVVCYMVGLGDRHASNILFDEKLCTFVHIDLGMILEYSKRTLPVPEQVPFRISRDVLDPILIEGIENGQLAEDCIQIMEKLKENGKVILGVASALLRQTMTNFKEAIEEQKNRPSYISEMAIGRLRDKLRGTDDGVTAQNSNLQIRRLLREATNADNLSRMFCGWMPFL